MTSDVAHRRRPGSPGDGLSLPESGRPLSATDPGRSLHRPHRSPSRPPRRIVRTVDRRVRWWTDGGQVCDERQFGPGTADLPPAVPASLRLSDVVAELAAIREVEGKEQIEEACRRVESLFVRLHRQFLADVVLDDRGFLGPAPAAPGQSVPPTFT